MTTRCRITITLPITDTRTHQSSTHNSHCTHEPTHLAERPSQYSILFHPVHSTLNHSIIASFKLAGDLDSPRFLPSFMNSTRQIQHCGNTGTHSHNRSLAQNSNTNISGFQCNRIVYLRFNNTSSHLTSSRSEGIQFGFNHIQFGPIRNQPSRFFFREQQLHTCTPEWEIAQTNQHNRTLQTRIHSHIQPPKATLRDHPPHPQILPF